MSSKARRVTISNAAIYSFRSFVEDGRAACVRLASCQTNTSAPLSTNNLLYCASSKDTSTISRKIYFVLHATDIAIIPIDAAVAKAMKT